MRLLRVCLLVLGGTLLASPVAAAPDQTLGVALMSAFVGNDGGLIGGVGVVSAERESLGTYRVTFVRSIDSNNCAIVATGTGSDIVSVPSTPVPVIVRTRDSFGDLSDRAFRLFVFCAQ